MIHGVLGIRNFSRLRLRCTCGERKGRGEEDGIAACPDEEVKSDSDRASDVCKLEMAEAEDERAWPFLEAGWINVWNDSEDES